MTSHSDQVVGESQAKVMEILGECREKAEVAIAEYFTILSMVRAFTGDQINAAAEIGDLVRDGLGRSAPILEKMADAISEISAKES